MQPRPSPHRPLDVRHQLVTLSFIRYVPKHTYLHTYVHTVYIATHTHTEREMCAALQQKVTDMDTQMGALAQMVCIHTHTHTCTVKKEDRRSRKKTDKDKPNSQTFINWSLVWDHNGNNTRREREVATLRGGYLLCGGWGVVGSRVWWVAVGGNRRSRQLRCQAANKKEMRINIFKGASPPIGCECECVL